MTTNIQLTTQTAAGIELAAVCVILKEIRTQLGKSLFHFFIVYTNKYVILV